MDTSTVTVIYLKFTSIPILPRPNDCFGWGTDPKWITSSSAIILSGVAILSKIMLYHHPNGDVQGT